MNEALVNISCELNDLLKVVELVTEHMEQEVAMCNKTDENWAAVTFVRRSDKYIGALWTIIHALRRWDGEIETALR